MREDSSPAPENGTPALSAVLRELEDPGGQLTLAEIARKLGIERSALEGMIQLLVRKGRLREVSEGGDACSACGLRPACGAGHSGGTFGACYELVRRDP